MKSKYINFLPAIFATFFATGAGANALADIYVGADLGIGGSHIFVDHDSEKHSTQSYGAVVGVDIPLLRFEAEYNYLNDKAVKLHVAMGNAYVKLLEGPLQPYLGVGIGSTFAGKIPDVPSLDIDTNLAYQAMGGVTFDVPLAPIKLDAEARVLYAPDICKIEKEQPDLLHYDLRLKLRYIF